MSREVVLDAEVPRLRRAAVALLVAFVPFTMIGIGWLVAAPVIGVPYLGAVVVGVVGAISVLSDPTNPAYRRVAFLGSVPVSFVLVLALLVLTFGDVEANDAYVLYLWIVISAGAAGWATYVLWPVVALSAE